MAKFCISRRELIKTGTLATAGLTLAGANSLFAASNALPLITRTIPSSRKELPVVGVGTNQFGTEDPEVLERIQTLLQELPGLGGQVIDTAHSYGNSEDVIGRLTQENGNRDKLFLATKTSTRGDVTMADIEAAFARLRTDHIDLIQVHNFNQTEKVIPLLMNLRSDARIGYVGCSTSRDSQYEDLKSAMRQHRLDFIQVDYSIANRSADEEILPMAQDRGVAVLINMPFGGRRNAASIFGQVSDVALPDWAAEIDVTSWAQFFLKYVVSHPAVTTAIPGTTKPHHMEDNMGAARGRLADTAMRGEMERFWDSLPG
ncbi:MAG TPA: aldo/keto reductase [Xanthomonadales bacterium]|nr:aldo/keto reductase [Xanthomonadales bacterium]